MICDNDYKDKTSICCYSCSKLISIPDIPGVDFIMVYDCLNLEKINIEYVKILAITDCPKIHNISSSHLSDLEINNCVNLTNITLNSKVKNITIKFCPILTIFSVQDCEMIDIQSCPLIIEFSSLISLKILHIDDSNVHSLPLLENLEQLMCYKCFNLKEIPSYNNLLILNCYNCPKLTMIHNSKWILNIHCDNCPLLYSTFYFSRFLKRNRNIIYAKKLQKQYHKIKRRKLCDQLLVDTDICKDVIQYVICEYAI